MTELRRSSRVRQLTKNSPQYYEPDEKKSILSTPHVRPRKWRSSEVSVGYFMVRRWVPRDQEHLTADLHGGLTEKAEVVTPAKPAMRAGSKGSARSKTRTRPGSAASPAGAASRARAPAYNRGEVRAPGLTPPPPPSPHPPAVPPTAGLPGATPLSGTVTAVLGGGRAGGRAGDASLTGVRGGGAGKRPASAMGRGSGAEGSPALPPPPAKSRRVSTEGAGLPLGPGSPASRGSAGPSTANWKRKRQSQSQAQKPSVWTTQLGNESLKAKKAGKAVVPGGEGAVGAGRGVGAMWGAGVGNRAPSRQWKV